MFRRWESGNANKAEGIRKAATKAQVCASPRLNRRSSVVYDLKKLFSIMNGS